MFINRLQCFLLQALIHAVCHKQTATSDVKQILPLIQQNCSLHEGNNCSDCDCFKLHNKLFIDSPRPGLIQLVCICLVVQNGNLQNPYCNGIEGVLEAYYQSLKSVRLYGPTHFSPVINHVAR